MKMNKILVIDLATHFGYVVIEDNKIIESGNINLSTETKMEDYISSQCRKSLPTPYYKGNWVEKEGKYCLVKQKKVRQEFSKKEQLERLASFIKLMKEQGVGKLVIEAPAIPFGKINIDSIRKQFSLYGVVELLMKVDKEIKPNEWFKWITDHFGNEYLIYTTNKKNESKIDRKSTSKKIASHIMNEEIKDDNESDAICIAHYIVKNKLFGGEYENRET